MRNRCFRKILFCCQMAFLACLIPLKGISGEPMVLVFNSFLSDGTTITLPLEGKVNVVIDWGDGTLAAVKNPGLVSHTYASNGIYTVRITGLLEQFGLGSVTYPNAEKLSQVTSFGDLGLISLSGAFHHAKNLRNISWDFPATVTDLSYMFYHGPARISGFYQDADVRHVINMQSMFEGLSPSISFENWDVSSVTNMTDMFKDGYINPISYNRMLIAWAELPLQDSVHLHAGKSKYSLGAATEARQRIIDHFHWTITDGGDDGFPLPPPVDLSTLNYDSILWPVRYDDPFSEYYFIIGYYRKYDYQMDYGLRLYLLDKHNEFLYATGGAMDSRSLRMDLFRETEEGFMPVWQIDTLIHTLVDDSPLIVMAAGGDEMGDWGSTVYFLENNQLQEIGYMNITQYDNKSPYEPQYNAIGPFTSITRHQNKYYFHFDTDQIAIISRGRKQRILDPSSFYYLFDGQTLELIIKNEKN